jgi:hypothetical protein
MEIKLDFIIDTLQKKTGLNLRRNTRKREYFLARAIYYKLAKEYTLCSLDKIGSEIGKDHATVLHGINKFNLEMKKYYPELYDLYENFSLDTLWSCSTMMMTFQLQKRLALLLRELMIWIIKIKVKDAEIVRLNLEIDLMKHNGEDKRSDIVKLVSEISEDQLPLFMERITAMVRMMNTTTA